MFLKSQGFASNLSDPKGTHTLEAFCQATGRPYASYGLPVPLDTFISYGQWFASELDLKVEEVLVTGLARRPGGFEISLADGERFVARQVVVAIGVEHFAYVPRPLSGLPASVCTHSSAHTDLAAFRGRDVVVVGAGQSALESAALLHENGAAVQVLARESAVAWNGLPLAPDRPLLQAAAGTRVRTRLGLGHLVLLQPPGSLPAPAAAHPGVPGPHGAGPGRGLLASRAGRGPVPGPDRPDRILGEAAGREGVAGNRRPRNRGRRAGRRSCDRRHRLPHRPEAAGVPARRRCCPRLQTVAGSAAVGRDYQSSVPGLYFIGPSVAPSMGPVMRFVFGARHAATAVGLPAGCRLQPHILPGHGGGPVMLSHPGHAPARSRTGPGQPGVDADRAGAGRWAGRSGCWRLPVPPTRRRWWPRRWPAA